MNKFHMHDAGKDSKSLRYLIDIVGEEAALAMIARFGGLQLPIPKQCDPEKSKVAAELANAIGEENARRICAACGDTPLYIPKASLGNKGRDSDMRSAYDKGTSVDALALLYRLTSRRVREILNHGSET